MKDKREKTFSEQLDYKKCNGVGAAELICGEVFELIDGKTI